MNIKIAILFNVILISLFALSATANAQSKSDPDFWDKYGDQNNQNNQNTTGGYYDKSGNWHSNNNTTYNNNGYYDQYGNWHSYNNNNNGYYDQYGNWHSYNNNNDNGYYDQYGNWHSYNETYYNNGKCEDDGPGHEGRDNARKHGNGKKKGLYKHKH